MGGMMEDMLEDTDRRKMLDRGHREPIPSIQDELARRTLHSVDDY